jgi:transmembrane sensor
MKKRNFKKPVKGQLTPEDENLIKRYFEVAADADHSERSTSFHKDGVYDRIRQTLEKREKTVNIYNLWKYVASVAVVAGVLFAAGYRYLQVSSNHQNIAYKQQEALRGHISKIELPDGTLVWLNAGSKLSFPENFCEDKREVGLEGEAYFEVKHETQRPFLVHTQSVVTQVLGTTFNVRSYAESGRIKVSVLSGKVAVYETDKAGKNITPQPLMVTANQEVIYSKVNRQLAYNTKQVISADAAAWKEGNLIFKNTELSEVINVLERRYNIDIALDSTMLNCPVTVDFNNQPIKQIMQILPHLVEGKLSESKGIYRLSGAGCQ